MKSESLSFEISERSLFMVVGTVRHFICATGLVNGYFLIAPILTSKTKKRSLESDHY